MSKFYITNDNMAELVKICRTVAAKDSKVVLHLGMQEINDKVICEVALTTDAEQVLYHFPATKPEDFTGAAEPMAVNAVKFLGIAESVLAFKEDIFLSPEGTMLVVGASNKAKTSIAIEAQTPQKIGQTEPLFKLQVDGKVLSSVLSKGCAFASDERGALHNAVIQLISKNDIIRGYSTDGHTIARSEGTVTYLKSSDKEQVQAQIAKMAENLEAVCQKNGLDKEAYPLIIPKEAVQHLSSIINGAGKVQINIDENHLHILVGNTLVYTITQANETNVPIPQIEAMASAEAAATYGLDAGKLSDAIGFINKNNAIVENKDIVTSISVKDEDILVSSGVSSQFESRVKALSINGEGEITVDGEKFKVAVDTLSRGNLVVSAYGQTYVSLFNGTAEKKDSSSFIILMQVIARKVSDAGDADEAAQE